MGPAQIAEKLKVLLETYVVVDQDDEEVKRVYRKHDMWMYESEADYDIEILTDQQFFTYENGEKTGIFS